MNVLNRRDFVKSMATTAITLAGSPMLLNCKSSPDKMNRIGMTTVVFRNRFRATASKDRVLTNELTLLDIPEYFSDRFGIRNLEFVIRHFESTETDYLDKIKKNLKRHKCRLIDIQTESEYDIADTDEPNRQKGIQDMKKWIDVAAYLDSRFVRIGKMKKSYNKSVDSLRVLKKYAQQQGVTIMVENHFDLFSIAENHVNIAKELRGESLGLIADFGNYPPEVDRYQSLEKIAPYVKLISAKANDFNGSLEHITYDYGRCVRIFEKAGYKGIYSLEQASESNAYYNDEKVADWMLGQVLEYI